MPSKSAWKAIKTAPWDTFIWIGSKERVYIGLVNHRDKGGLLDKQDHYWSEIEKPDHPAPIAGNCEI